jgi:hypothetical protein
VVMQARIKDGLVGHTFSFTPMLVNFIFRRAYAGGDIGAVFRYYVQPFRNMAIREDRSATAKCGICNIRSISTSDASHSSLYFFLEGIRTLITVIITQSYIVAFPLIIKHPHGCATARRTSNMVYSLNRRTTGTSGSHCSGFSSERTHLQIGTSEHPNHTTFNVRDKLYPVG